MEIAWEHAIFYIVGECLSGRKEKEEVMGYFFFSGNYKVELLMERIPGSTSFPAAISLELFCELLKTPIPANRNEPIVKDKISFFIIFPPIFE